MVADVPAQIGEQVAGRGVAVLAGQQPSVDLDAAAVGHGVDADAAFDAADAECGRAEQRIDATGPQLLGEALDVR